MMKTALLIVDVQVSFIDGTPPVHNAQAMLARITSLIARARAAGVPVIFVQHVEEPEVDGPLHPALAPTLSDPIINKLTPDAFHETGLQATLRNREIDTLVLAGFQTEYCIDTTCRRARSMGYRVTLAADAHSTFSFDDAPLNAEQIIAHHTHVLGAFATVIPAADIMF